MHEMGVAMQIIEIATASIPEELAGARVEKVKLKVGKMAAIVPSSLSFCFEVATKDTELEGAELVIEEVPVRLRCTDCDHQWQIEKPAFNCPQCDSGAVEMLTGRELDIDAIEIAEEDDNHAAL